MKRAKIARCYSPRRSAVCTAIPLAILALVLAVATTTAYAQTYKVLYSFGNNGGVLDGNVPNGGLIFDSAGNIYGTTTYGGTNCLAYGEDGCGTVFELSPSGSGWIETVLYSFCATGSLNGCLDGASPYAGLVADQAGNLYGTTQGGGTAESGTVFELSPPSIPGGAWTETVLYAFGGNGSHDGCYPLAKVTFDGAGDLYGTTSGCGTYGYGTVYELSPGSTGWVETNLHMFGGRLVQPHDGGEPKAAVQFDPYGNSGSLFGTAEYYGAGGGIVYELSPGSGGEWVETILAKFPPYPGTGEPMSVVSFDPNGDLYGTLSQGGSGICGGYDGCGGVFKLSPKSGGGYSTHTFDFDGGNGYAPTGGLDLGLHSAYGITQGGGGGNCGGAVGCGTVFSITSKAETVVYSFCSQPSCADGTFQGEDVPGLSVRLPNREIWTVVWDCSLRGR